MNRRQFIVKTGVIAAAASTPAALLAIPNPNNTAFGNIDPSKSISRPFYNSIENSMGATDMLVHFNIKFKRNVLEQHLNLYTSPWDFKPHRSNMRFMGVIVTENDDEEINAGPYSIAAAYGGILPERFQLVLESWDMTELLEVAGQVCPIHYKVTDDRTICLQYGAWMNAHILEVSQ